MKTIAKDICLFQKIIGMSVDRMKDIDSPIIDRLGNRSPAVDRLGNRSHAVDPLGNRSLEVDLLGNVAVDPSGILAEIKQLQHCTTEIQVLTDKHRTAIDDKYVEQVNHIVRMAQQKNHAIKTSIIQLKSTIQQQPSDFKRRAFANIYDLYAQTFQKALTEFHDAVENFHDLVFEKNMYQLKTIHPELDDAQVRNIMEHGATQEIISNGLMILEKRHEDILQLEKQVLEIYELMRDFAVLIDLQQEQLNVVELRIKGSVDSVDRGARDVVKANHYARMSHRRMMMLCCCVLAVLCTILLPMMLKN